MPLYNPHAGLSTANTFTAAQTVVANPGSGQLPTFETGPGTQYGAPSAAPTVATGAAGALTGAYTYAYTETDFWGESTLSPVSATVNPSSQKVTVTIPLPRRGTSSRKLYRTVAGGSTYKLVSQLSSGGSGYFQTVFTDNLADGSLGATAPVADTTKIMNLHVTDSVKYLRTSPAQGSSPADLTILTSDPSGSALSIDAYGPILCRASPTQAGVKVEHVAVAGAHSLEATWLDSTVAQDAQTPPTPTTVFYVDSPGNTVIQPGGDYTPLTLKPFTSATVNTLIVRDVTDASSVLTVNKSGQTKIVPSADTSALILQANTATAGTNLLQLNQVSGAGTAFFTVGATGMVAIQPSVNVNPAFKISDTTPTTWFSVRTDTGATTIAGALNMNNTLNLQDAKNITLGTSTGCKLGTSTSQKLGFWNAAPVVQQARPTDAATIITLLTTLGLCA